MDRRNGGDPLAPPRPPKSLPRVHRPRAPEPDIVNLPINFNRMDSNLSSNSSISSSSTTATATTTHNHLQQQQPPSRQHSIPPPLPPLTPTQQQTSSNRINSNSNNNNNNNINNNNINMNMNNNNIINNNNNSNLMSTTSISTFSRRRPDVATGSTGQLRQLTTPLPTLQVRALTPSTLGQITSVPSTNFISTALSAARTPSPVNNSVTLQIPRPENERLPNEYVDTPFTNATANASSIGGGHGGNGSGSGSGSSSSSNVLRGSSHHSQQQQLVSSQPNRTNHLNHSHTNISTIDGISVINNHNSNNNDKVILPNRTGAVRPNLLPITKQPSFNSSTTTLCKKDQLQQQFGHDDNGVISSANNNNGLILNSATDQLNSITCPQCNRCRCEECQRPRKLPSRWICDDNCFCSAETIIDFASCLCCVKALYYHCSKDHELDCESDSISCADNPCSCVPYKRTSRWGCLSALSLLLPCLLCYWPMRGCVSLCAKCYAKHSRHGCRCNNEQSTNNNNNFNSRLNIINLTSSNGPESPQPPTNHHHHRRSNNNDLTPEKRLLDSSNSEY